jgi:hypothetical protein
MGDEQTCGKGLAERSPLPAKIGQLIAALTKNLELHQGTLDTSDDRSKKELDAYVTLAAEYRRIAQELEETAKRMAGYRDLPMGRHDPARLADRKLVDAFAAFVTREQELLTLLQQFLERDQKMLGGMRGA